MLMENRDVSHLECGGLRKALVGIELPEKG